MFNPKTYALETGNLTPSPNAKSKKIKVTASSSIMTNYEPARSITSDHRIVPIEDKNGNPIVFSVGTNNDLYAITQSSGKDGAWKQRDISLSVEQGGTLEDFAVFAMPNNKFVLAMAVSVNGTLHFYVTPALDADPDAGFWDDFGKQFHERENGFNLKSVSRIIMGDSDHDGIPSIIVMATSDGTNYDRYIVKADVTVQDKLWSLWPIPQNAHRTDGTDPIVDIAIGKLSDFGMYGTYSLYYVGDDLQLTFDTLQTLNGQTLSHQMVVPASAHALATVPGDSSGNTDLFAAGDGIYHYKADKQGNNDKPLIIASDLKASEGTELEVLSDGHNYSIWYLDKEVLSYMTSAIGSGQWTLPLPLKKDVGQIAALRNKSLKTNELFDVDAGNNLTYFYQDPGSTIWKETPIQLKDVGKAVPFKCYTTVVHFEDENGAPIHDLIKVSASEWQLATINGEAHILDLDSQVGITPDGGGSVTVITKINSASSPVISFSSTGFEEVVDVHPSQIIAENLKSFSTGEAIDGSTTQTGEKVITSGSKISSKDLAEAFKKMTAAADTASDKPMVIRSAGSGFSNKVNLKLLNKAPSNQILVRSAESSDSGIVAFFGDVLHSIVNGLKKVGQWVLHVVDEGLQFVVHLAEGIATFILDTVEKIYQVLSWVLEQIEMGLEKLIEWIGQLFGWKDIITCHNIISNSVNQLLDWVATESEDLKKPINNTLDSMASTLTGAKLPDDISGSGLSAASNTTKSQHSQEAQDNGNYTKSPAGGFANYHLSHSGPASSDQSISATVEKTIDDFMKLIEQLGEDVYHTTKVVIMDIVNGIASGKMSMSEILERVTSDAILGTLDTLKHFTNNLLDVIADIVKAVKAVLNQSIDIPFISELYKLITGDNKLSILNVLSLIVSVPAVTMIKIISGKSPFANGTYGLDNSALTPNQFMNLIKVDSNSKNSFVATGGMNVTMLAASLGDEEEKPSAGVLYSQIGGAVFIIGEIINDVLTVLNTVAKVTGVFTNWIKFVVQGFIVGSSFPAVVDSAFGWRFLKWALKIGGLTVLYCSAVDPEYGLVAGAFNILFGILGLILAFGIPIKVSFNGNGYQIGMAWTAFVGSLGVTVGVIAAGIGKYDFEPDSLAIIAIVASIGFAVKVLFDLIREGIVVGLDTQKEYRPFYA